MRRANRKPRGCPATRKLGATRVRVVATVVVLTLGTVACLFLVSCSRGESERGDAGIPVRPGEPPALRVISGEMSVIALRNGFTWPSDSGVRKVQENPFIPFPSDKMLVEPGQEVLFRLEGTTFKPARATLTLSYHQDFFDPDTPRQLIAAQDITRFSSSQGGFTFKWKLPRTFPAGSPGELEAVVPKYELRVKVRWTRPEGAEVNYMASLSSPDPDEASAVRSAIEVCETFFEAAWSGNGDLLLSMASAQVLRKREALETSSTPDGIPGLSPFAVSLDLGSPWELLLWRSEGYSFELKSEPTITLRSMDAYKYFAEAEVSYTVEVTETKTNQKSTWDYTEEYLLRRTLETWVVDRMDRTGIPRQLSGGQSGRGEKGWGVRLSREIAGGHTVISWGDFPFINPWKGQAWSDDEKYLTFIAENFGRKEMWVVARDGTELKRLICLEPVRSAGVRISDQDILILGWVPQQHRVRFLVSGHQVMGPHAEEYGYWVGEVDPESGEIYDLAFITAYSPAPTRPQDVSVTRDRTALMFLHGDDLWRVDFQERETSRVVPNIRPAGRDLFKLNYSPSGWHGAYQDGDRVAIYDLRTGEKRLTEAARGLAFFLGWSTGEMVAVGLADEEEVNYEEDSSYPAGVRSLRFYDVNGELKTEVLVPSGKAGVSIGPWAWAPDDRMLAFTTGKVVETGAESPMGTPLLMHQADEVWVWEDPLKRHEAVSAGSEASGASAAKPRKLADVSGIVESVEWDPSGEFVDVWFRTPVAEPRPEQTGVRISPAGHAISRSRPNPHALGLRHQDVLIGAMGGREYFLRADDRGSRVFARDPAGNEYLLLQGEFRVDYAKVDKGALVLVTRSGLDAAGERSRVYLIVP